MQQALKCGRPWMGPWLFGISLDLFLLAILTVQIYMYYLAFPKDRRLLKLAVVGVYFVGIAQTIQAVVDLLGAINDPLALEDLQLGCDTFVFSFASHTCLTVIASSSAVALTTQLFYAYRIYVISHKLWILVLVICLSLAQSGASIIGCVCSGNDFFSRSDPQAIGEDFCQLGFVWVWGPLNVACDATITLSMSILLLKRRKGVLKKTTHNHLTNVIRIVVETGLMTSALVVVYTLVYDLNPITSGLVMITAWLVPGLAMGKVYSNSMLALLNSRLTISGGRNTGDPFGISEIRPEVLRTEVGSEDQASDVLLMRRRAPSANEEGSVPT